jgi:thiamine-phosphate pyrophosphorylase
MSKNAAIDFSLYLISNRQAVPRNRTLSEVVEQALAAGVRAVQLREKDLSAAELLRLAGELRRLTRRYGARLLINDRLDVALAARADGVHLGESSLPTAEARRLLGPQALIGRSTHHLEDALQAGREGADFVTFSPIYFTPSKAAYGAPQGLAALQQVCAACPLPVFALGGLRRERIGEVRAAGAAGIALISAIVAAPDPGRAARDMLAELTASDQTSKHTS